MMNMRPKMSKKKRIRVKKITRSLNRLNLALKLKIKETKMSKLKKFLLI